MIIYLGQEGQEQEAQSAVETISLMIQNNWDRCEIWNILQSAYTPKM